MLRPFFYGRSGGDGQSLLVLQLLHHNLALDAGDTGMGQQNLLDQIVQCSHGAAFARAHGPSVASMGWRGVDAQHAYDHAVAKRAKPYTGPGKVMDVPAIKGIDGEGVVDGGETKILLQIFSKTVVGPIFFEFIQRKGDDGFGEGNFQALFESIEADQIARGVLSAG